ncbi:MAG: hypothetical protein ACJAWL_003024 [Motiliproteus sp.]|jgi:hypothetical protein
MKMKSSKRAIDKLYKRRDRYDIPDWQRQEVWGKSKKQSLIDSILKGWKLPKFYLLKTNDSPEEYEVVDGQQRLSSILDFFDNELSLSPATAERLGAEYYRELKDEDSDGFDDFEIEYDLIEDASDEEVKEFFQRLQEGLPLTSAEKLNSVHSNLRDFCSELVKKNFFKSTVCVSDKRHGHFDIAAKAACIEIDGIAVGLRIDDMQAVFESQSNFSKTSEVAKRLLSSIDFLNKALGVENPKLRNRSFVQSLITLASAIVSSGNHVDLEERFNEFVNNFIDDLSIQVEKGQKATDKDYLDFQKTISANTKSGPRIRHQVMMRKLLSNFPEFSQCFSPDKLEESGIIIEVRTIAHKISDQVSKLNEMYSAKNGGDLFKSTNKTVSALQAMATPLKDFDGYKDFIENMYFIFHEGPGTKLDGIVPSSLQDINSFRTSIQHDLDHGKENKVKKKQIMIGEGFKKYSGYQSPEMLNDDSFVVVQANLLNAIYCDLVSLNTLIKA